VKNEVEENRLILKALCDFKYSLPVAPHRRQAMPLSDAVILIVPRN
jgi:hypothetical protein